MRLSTANKPGRAAYAIVIVLLLIALGYGALRSAGAIWLKSRAEGNSNEIGLGEGAESEVSLEALSNINHGDSLAEVMEGIRQEDFEVTAVFTADGEKLFEYTSYSGDNVQLSAEHVQLMRKYDGIIRLHNHPLECHASFSRSDLESLVGCHAGYGIIVSKNATYVVTPNRKWPSVDEIDTFMREHTDMMEVVWPPDYDEEIPVTTKELMELVAEEYNLRYYEWSKSKVSSEEVARAILGG